MNNIIKDLRKQEKVTQDDLACAVGVTRQTIGSVENGSYNPTLKLCIDICRALGKTLNDLFWEEDSNEEERK